MKFIHSVAGSALLLVLAAMSGCGDGTSGGSDGDIAGGGIGGTGSGTVTGFGSVIINDTREFALGDSTQVRIDGESGGQDDLAVGMVVRFEVGEDVNDDFTTGTASIIEATHQIKGPVTSLSPLSVLGQTVTLTGDTVLDGFSAASSLVVGDQLEVSGHADASGVVRATRLELKPAGLLSWKLVGVATAVTADGFLIGNQQVSFNGVSARDCGGALVAGDLVEVKAAPVSGFGSGDVLGSVTDIECVSGALVVSGSAVANVIAGEIEGFVSSISTADSQFVVNGQTVSFRGATVFDGGTVDDLIVGVKLEAEGRFDTQTGVLSATKIRFREARVRIEAPVASVDIVQGESLDILGVHVIATAQTRDDDDIVSAGSGDQQVEVRGFVDGDGNVIAEEVRQRGNSDFTDVRLRGPVTAYDQAQSEVSVLGVAVDLSVVGSLNDSGGAVLNLDTFYSLLQIGSMIQARGEYNDASDILTADEVQLED